MAYATSIRTLEKIKDEYADALRGEVCVWQHPNPVWWAYKLREGLDIARWNPEAYPELSELSDTAYVVADKDSKTVTLYPVKPKTERPKRIPLRKENVRNKAVKVPRDLTKSPAQRRSEAGTDDLEKADIALASNAVLIADEEPERESPPVTPVRENAYHGPQDEFSIIETWDLQQRTRPTAKVVFYSAGLMPHQMQSLQRWAANHSPRLDIIQNDVAVIVCLYDPSLHEV